ncbi:MAG: TadE/TadG family type IV pilus assembly protein [Coriobacteriia bacterium]|nr:TadE/TadG family type IV pilus assembly protein [Coriobacteriia bacterium]
MGCDGDALRHRVRGKHCARNGQGTVEYALVLFAVLALLGGMGSLWHLAQAGSLVQHALQDASHHVGSLSPGALADTFLY